MRTVAIFQRIGDETFIATPAATGPWSELHCHGGAPASLLASAMADHPVATPMELSRLTMDLLKAVPVGKPLRVVRRELQQGRRTQLIGAELFDGDVLLAAATGLRVRRVESADLPEPSAQPDPSGHRPMPGGFSHQFMIIPEVGGFGELGPAEVWFRLESDLIGGEANDPAATAVAVADFGGGISHSLSFQDWQFPSLDLSVGLTRQPRGEWIRLASRWMGVDGGRTCCRTTLSDRHGDFGYAMQTVLLERRT